MDDTLPTPTPTTTPTRVSIPLVLWLPTNADAAKACRDFVELLAQLDVPFVERSKFAMGLAASIAHGCGVNRQAFRVFATEAHKAVRAELER